MYPQTPGFGKIHKLHGEKSDVKLMHYAASLQRSNPVIYVDCANTFDPYFVYRRSGKDSKSLQRIHIARPFTLYQLVELVNHKLEEKIQHTQSQTLLIPMIDAYSWDSIFEKQEYEVVTAKIMEKLGALTRDYHLLTMISMGEDSD